MTPPLNRFCAGRSGSFGRLLQSRYIGVHMTHSLRRVIVLFVLAAASLGVAAPAVMATTVPSVGNEIVMAQSETVAAQPYAQPYVEVDPAVDEPDEPQWTYRYLIPAVVALTVVLIIGTVIMYFVKVVRGRYTVVD